MLREVLVHNYENEIPTRMTGLVSAVGSDLVLVLPGNVMVLRRSFDIASRGEGGLSLDGHSFSPQDQDVGCRIFLLEIVSEHRLVI